MVYPFVWVEDDFYLESSYLVSAGLRPYLDFIHPHMPVLELIVGNLFRIVGASHRSAELLNEAAVYAASVMTYTLAMRIGGRATATIAALLYACSSLVFRYHVYERETFAAVLILAASLSATNDSRSAGDQTIRQTAFFTLACAIKLTSVVPFAAVLIYLGPLRRQWRATIASAVLTGVALALLTAIFYWRYGSEFFFQTFLFHFLKGNNRAAVLPLYPLELMDVIVPLFLLGIFRIVSERPATSAFRLVALIVGIIAYVISSRYVAKPLVELMGVASQLSKGVVDLEFTYAGTDELGSLAQSFREVIDYNRAVAAACESLGRGDLTVTIPARSDKDTIAHNFTRTVEIFSHGTSLPKEENSFSLDPDLKDAWGLPALRMTFRDHPNDLKMMEWMQARALEILEVAGAKSKWGPPVQEQQFAVHLLGTCRMGNDPKTSVINADHRTHDVKNLFLCDGSSLVTSGRGQPTMTIQALAYRAADRITALAKRGEISA